MIFLFNIILLSLKDCIFHPIFINVAKNKKKRTFLTAILLTGLTLVEREKKCVGHTQKKQNARMRNRAQLLKLRFSLFEISTVSSSQCYHLFHTFSQLLQAPAKACQPCHVLHTQNSPSPRCSQANNGQPLTQFTRNRGRDVLLGVSCVPLAQTPSLPLLDDADTGGAGHVEASVFTQTLSGAMCVELNEHRTLFYSV